MGTNGRHCSAAAVLHLQGNRDDVDLMKEYSYAITAHPRGQPVTPPSLLTGYLVILGSLLFLCVGSYATLFSAFIPLKGWNLVLDVLIDDTHYKYFILLFIPTSAYFVIANWVGWQYYQNS